MQEDQPGSIRNELLERLRAMEGAQTSSGLADLAYRRAREALERALEEARTIRLQAIEDARNTRERELTSLMDSMKSLRESAEAQIDALLRSAEIEAGRLKEQAQAEATQILERAERDASNVRAEAAALRAAAEERAREMERLEAEFNKVVRLLAQRLGVKEEPPGGWWQHLTGKR